MAPEVAVAFVPRLLGLRFICCLLQPALLAKIVPKAAHSFREPLPFTDERGQPLRVMKETGESKEGNDSGEFVQNQKCGDVCKGCVDQGCCVFLQESGNWKDCKKLIPEVLLVVSNVRRALTRCIRETSFVGAEGEL